MRWHDGELVDRHGRTRAIVRPLPSSSATRATVWEVHVSGHEVIRAGSEAAGRKLALDLVAPPAVEQEGHR